MGEMGRNPQQIGSLDAGASASGQRKRGVPGDHAAGSSRPGRTRLPDLPDRTGGLLRRFTLSHRHGLNLGRSACIP